jgi:hypothetical protein
MDKMVKLKNDSPKKKIEKQIGLVKFKLCGIMSPFQIC